MRSFDIVIPPSLPRGPVAYATLEIADDPTSWRLCEEVQASEPGTRIRLACWWDGPPPRYFRLGVTCGGLSYMTPTYHFPRDAP
jgi:hypothetical protein